MVSCSLWVAIISHILAPCLKPVFNRIKTKEWDWTLLFTNGKFPSSHAATVGALTMRIAFDCGFNSTYFAISFILSAIVVADATGVRKEVGKHAKYINQQLQQRKPNDPFPYFEMKELVGHSMVEVLGGLALGIIVVLVSLVFCSPYCH